jgi:hypothetical protein
VLLFSALTAAFASGFVGPPKRALSAIGPR